MNMAPSDTLMLMTQCGPLLGVGRCRPSFWCRLTAKLIVLGRAFMWVLDVLLMTGLSLLLSWLCKNVWALLLGTK